MRHVKNTNYKFNDKYKKFLKIIYDKLGIK